MTYAEFEQLMTFYYQAPSPPRVPAALAFAVHHVIPLTDQHVEELMRYSFQRIAQLTPSVVEGYAAAVVGAAGSPGEQFLTSLLLGVLPRAEVEALIAAQLLAAGPPHIARPINLAASAPVTPALNRQIEGPGDLDFLWSEFTVTGSEASVNRIIDVLDRPDMVRARLMDWYTTWSRLELFRKRKCRAIERATGITYDPSSGSILPADDLDLFPTWGQGNSMPERWTTLRRALPFRLSAVEAARVMTKCAARWSLESNANQHAVVLDICRREAAIREGPSRASLHQIIAACERDRASEGGTR